MHRLALIVAAAFQLSVMPSTAAWAQAPLPPVRVGNGIPQPRKTKDVKPAYPPEAQGSGIQGVVIIEATIGPTGLVLDTHVLRSIPVLDGAAVNAVRQWEFTPTIVDGVPRSVIMTVTVNFTLSGPNVSPVPPAPAPAASPAGSTPSMIMLTFVARPDGSRFTFEISPDRAERLPRWDQLVSFDPPLSMGDARKAAEAWLKKRSPDVKTLELASANLLRAFPRPPEAGVCGSYGCWYYRFSFNPMIGDRRTGGGPDFTSVVLLDGSIVEPRTETVVTPAGGGRGGGIGAGAGAGVGAGSQQASAPPPGGAYHLGDTGLTPPRLVREVKPQYTSDALRAKVQGTVMLEVMVKPDGTVDDIRIVRSLDSTFGLDEEAIKAARQWRFEPGTVRGAPVPVIIRLEMSFAVAQ